MGRIRSIKPEYFVDEDVAELPPLVRLLFVGMWTHADKAGRLKDKPRTLKALCLPFDDIDVDDALNQLVAAGFIYRYESEGVAVIAIRTWEEHQRPHHTEKESALPPMDNGDVTVTSPLNNGTRTEHSQDAPFPMTRNKKQETRDKKPCRHPTLEEVQQEIAERGYHFDAQEFYDHYQANGWRVGRNPMKDWRAAVRQWNRRQGDFTKPDRSGDTRSKSQIEADAEARKRRSRQLIEETKRAKAERDAHNVA